MIPFILGALAAVGLSELSKRNSPKMAHGGKMGGNWVVGKDSANRTYFLYNQETGERKGSFSNINEAKKELSKYAKGGGVGKYSKIDLVVKKPYGDEHFEVAKFKKTGDAIISANALGKNAPSNYEYYVKATNKYANGGAVGEYRVMGIVRFYDDRELNVNEIVLAVSENDAISKVKKRYIGAAPDSDLFAEMM